VKIKSLFVAVLLVLGAAVPIAQSSAADYEWPVVESFTVTPTELDLAQASPTVTFTLVVTHNVGIQSTSTNVNVSNAASNSTVSTKITRTDSPVNPDLKKVTFKGTLTFPYSLSPGLYTFNADAISAVSPNGIRTLPTTGVIYPKKFSDFVGGETSIILRSNGELNLDFQTFVGPSYPSSIQATDDKTRTIVAETPIWKVGETYSVDSHFDMRTPLVKLQIATTTPDTCTADGKIMKFIAIGTCSFTVFTPKDKNYLYKSLQQTEMITAARQKLVIGVTKIATQDVTTFPKVLMVTSAYTTSGDLVIPISTTPSICIANAVAVQLNAGGMCTLTYKADATKTHLASDLYTQSFEILKDGKSVVVPTPVVTPTPVATPTPTAAPVVKKTITCVKGKKTVKKTAVSPKCPAGYKLKK
jgi:hypothetical protein